MAHLQFIPLTLAWLLGLAALILWTYPLSVLYFIIGTLLLAVNVAIACIQDAYTRRFVAFVVVALGINLSIGTFFPQLPIAGFTIYMFLQEGPRYAWNMIASLLLVLEAPCWLVAALMCKQYLRPVPAASGEAGAP